MREFKKWLLEQCWFRNMFCQRRAILHSAVLTGVLHVISNTGHEKKKAMSRLNTEGQNEP